MERWLTRNITRNMNETMKSIMEATMKEMLKLIQFSIDTLLLAKLTMEAQTVQLKRENVKLNNEINYLKCEVKSIQKKISRLGDKFLERNLIFHGIEEGTMDKDSARAEKVFKVMSNTINRDTQQECLQVAGEVS